MINITNSQDCCGCGACVQRCPKKCIILKEDKEGFLYPVVNEEFCINCGLCDKVCPLQNIAESCLPHKVLAVKNRSQEERMKSSSGGVFITLAKKVIENGGVVFGAVFDINWDVKHVFANDLDGVKLMMGSKYVQSYVGESYRQAENFLKKGIMVLFTGCPCQIAGLHKYLNKDYPNLLTVDFLCHGVPSPGVWRKYLKEIYEQISFKIDKHSKLRSHLRDIPIITSIDFRNKDLSGWESYHFIVRARLTSDLDCDSIILSHTHNKDPYMRGFLSNLYLRPCCYDCKCKNGVSQSDITIADYWGIKNIMPDFDDDKGIGLVLLNTDKGIKYFDVLDFEVRISSLDDAKQFNGGFKNKVSIPIKNRSLFFKHYRDNDIPFSLIVEKCLRVSLREKIYKKIINLKKRIVG